MLQIGLVTLVDQPSLLISWFCSKVTISEAKCFSLYISLHITYHSNSRNKIKTILKFSSSIHLHPKLNPYFQDLDRMDRNTFREFLHDVFNMTDDILMDRIFKFFDTLNDGNITREEWVLGHNIFLKGSMEEQIGKRHMLKFKIPIFLVKGGTDRQFPFSARFLGVFLSLFLINVLYVSSSVPLKVITAQWLWTNSREKSCKWSFNGFEAIWTYWFQKVKAENPNQVSFCENVCFWLKNLIIKK